MQIRKLGDLRDRSRIPFGNPLVGLIYVEGAKPSGSIMVEIKDVRPTIGQGAIYSSEFSERYLTEVPILKFTGGPIPRRTEICRIEDSSVFFKGLKIPYKPMIGTIGTAPHTQRLNAYLQVFFPEGMVGTWIYQISVQEA